MSKLLDVMLLFALPASGKSEVRKYLSSLSPEECRNDFMMGETVQLDDYPYVHIMRTISQELRKLGADGIFFDDDSLPMKEGRDWGTLIHLVNEDYNDLLAQKKIHVVDPALWVLERFDAAREKVGAPPAFKTMDFELKSKLLNAHPFVQEAEELLRDKNKTIQDIEGKTVVIEAARGGAVNATMPLKAPYGYQYSIPQFSDDILSRAGICYIWVTPEDSHRKNRERAKPTKAASTFLSLNHGVPDAVMDQEYGCDDMAYMLETSGKEDCVKIEAHGKTYYLPVARFDNREDKTTFARAPKEEWKAEDVKKLRDGLAEAFNRLAKARG